MASSLQDLRGRIGAGASRLLRSVRAAARPASLLSRDADRTPKADLDALSEAAGRLGSLVDDLEERFLKAGTGLERHAEHTAQLIQRSERLLELVTGHAGGEQLIRCGMDTLAHGLDFIERCHRQTIDLQARLRAYHGQLEDMKRHEESLRSALAPLKYVQTLFRIESATLPVDVQSTFLGLTRDIEELFERFGQVFGEQYQNLARSRDSIGQLVGTIEGHAIRQQSTALEKRNQMRRTLDDLMTEVKESLGRDVTLVSVSRSINAGVGEVVVALQCQDIVRQKLQHIVSACGEIVGRPPSAGGAAVLPAGLQRGFVREAARIQVRQVDAILSDLADAQQRGRHGMERLVELAHRLDAESMNLSEFKSVTSAENGMVQVLLTALEEVRSMLSTIVEVQKETHRTLKPLSGMASNVTGVMRNLSGHIKLIALNAQIQAAQVGQGTGLEVLSENTTRISDEIYRLNEKASEDLDRLIAGLVGAVGESAALHSEAEQAHRTLGDEGRDLERQLHDYRDSTLSCFMAVGQLNATFTDEAVRMIDELEFLDPAHRILDPLRELLERLASAPAASLDDPEDAALLRARLRTLERNYTMESERTAHADGAVPEDGVAPPQAVPSGVIEFFDAPSGGPAVPPPSATADAPPPQSRPDAPAPGLGGNVELF